MERLKTRSFGIFESYLMIIIIKFEPDQRILSNYRSMWDFKIKDTKSQLVGFKGWNKLRNIR
jgi:hypothetical protein